MTNSIKNIFTVFLLFFSTSCTIAQNTIDYFEIKKETVKYTCSKFDTNSVNLTLKNLLAIDTLKISKGLWNYHYDLGMAYYMKAGLYDQNEWFYPAISNFNKCILLEKKNGAAYHNIALIYYFLHDYENAKIFLNSCKKYTKKKYWDKDLIKTIENAK